MIWSDESKFGLFRGNKRLAWRRPHEKYDVDCLIPTVKSGQQGVIVGITKYNLGPLVKLDGKVAAAVYVNILKKLLVTISR